MNEFNLEEALLLLERTPRMLKGWLGGGLSEAWLTCNEGPGTWSPRVVVEHLLHAERVNWPVRAKIILRGTNPKRFAPFQREPEPVERPMDELLADFESTRFANVQLVRSWSLTDEDLSPCGLHPELGEVTLRQLFATWVAHDLDHTAQIARVMAKRYTTAVGPWATYLRVLRG